MHLRDEVKSLLSLAAFVWFAFNAATFGDGGVWDPTFQQVDGDQGVIAVHQVARILFIGLALLSLALTNWAPVNEFIHRLPGPGGERAVD
jgi:hypothetical protein